MHKLFGQSGFLNEVKRVIAPKRGHTPKVDFRSAFLFSPELKNIFLKK